MILIIRVITADALILNVIGDHALFREVDDVNGITANKGVV